MTVNGVKPDANGDVAVDLSGIVELKGKVARLNEDMSSAQSAIADRYTKRETDEKIAAATPSDYDAVKGRVAAVEAKVPTQASAQNQLADKAFVNSSIATNTAFYISDGGRPFQSLADLENYEGALTNNDYAFVVGRDAAGNTTYTRYKWSEATETWAEEFVLNNSSFTAAQWEAISSGITSGLVAKLDALPTAEALAAALSAKADATAVDNRIPYANSGKTSIVVGTGNDNHDKGSVAIFGARNNVQSGYTLVGGYGNSLDDGSNGSIVGGYNNEVHGKRNIVGGGSNTTGSTEGKNTVTGSDMIVSGRDNNASGSFSIVSGQGNSVTGDRELFIGQGLKGQYNDGALLGQYNYPLNGVRFSIGCGGSDSTRQNALVLTDDGALYLKGVGGYNGTTFVGASSLAVAFSDNRFAAKTELRTHTGNTTIHITANERAAWNAKQNALTFDATPTAGSSNPVTSGGLKTALDTVENRVSELDGDVAAMGDTFGDVYTAIDEVKGLIVKQPEIQFDTTDVFVFSREDSIIVTDRFDTLTMPETLVYDGTGADHTGDVRYEHTDGVYWKGESEDCTVLLYFVPSYQQFRVTVLDSDDSHGGRIGYTTYTIDDAHSSETESLSLTCGPDSLVFRRSQPAVNEIEALHNETEALRSALRYDMVDAEVGWRGFWIPAEWFPIVVDGTEFSDGSDFHTNADISGVVIENNEFGIILVADNSGRLVYNDSEVTLNGQTPEYGVTQLEITSNPSAPGFYTYQLQDRAINTIHVLTEGSLPGFVIPPPDVDGKVRDFAIHVIMEPDSTVGQIVFDGMTLVNADGEMPEIAPGYSSDPGDPDFGDDPVETILYFTEISPNTFLVKGETVKYVGS